MLGADELRRIVAWAREHGVLVFSDECYLELGWEADPVSVLHPDVCGGSHDGLVAVHSLSKRSNLAGYRAAFLAGDAAVLGELLQIRKHGGMMIAAPVQAATVAALGDTAHVAEQRERYAAPPRRAARRLRGRRLPHRAQRGLASTCGRPATSPAGTPSASSPSAASSSPPASSTAPAGERFVRIAFTATDERVAAAVRRLAE